MMRSIEILLVIIIMTGAFLTASFFAVLPEPRRVSPLNLRRLALTTLQTLDVKHDISDIAFDTNNQTAWNQLQIALSASLPSNIVYNLTVYDLSSAGGTALYTACKSISNAESLGIGSDVASYMVASSNVTFNLNPQKIGVTIYILNCSDANGWWITGYTGQTIAEDLYKMLSPYFQTAIMVQNTTQLQQMFNGQPLQNETLSSAVIINTCGEAAPISGNCASKYSANYAEYCYQVGNISRLYNWTWASIVGYPFYYVTNTLNLTGNNGWGIYGMAQVGPAGLNNFLRGLDNQPYNPQDNGGITSDVGDVYLTPTASDKRNEYGIYPSPNQTSTRALPSTITGTYDLNITTMVFSQKNNAYPGAVYRHIAKSDVNITGSLFALGLARVPDIRLTALGLLCDYKPIFHKSQYTAAGTSRLIVLQLGQVGGV
jgi:hypothetical protein